MINILIFIVVSILVAIACLHFYWAMGGQKWGDIVIPEMPGGGTPMFEPPPLITALVGVLLLDIAFFVLVDVGWLPFPYFLKWIHYLVILAGVIFVIRSIGDFKYTGFFKRIRDTKFAYYDTRIFSPLCLFLGLSILLISLYY